MPRVKTVVVAESGGRVVTKTECDRQNIALPMSRRTSKQCEIWQNPLFFIFGSEMKTEIMEIFFAYGSVDFVVFLSESADDSRISVKTPFIF